jgi:hypothetical protein
MEEEIEMCYSITEKKKKKSIFLFWGGRFAVRRTSFGRI